MLKRLLSVQKDEKYDELLLLGRAGKASGTALAGEHEIVEVGARDAGVERRDGGMDEGGSATGVGNDAGTKRSGRRGQQPERRTSSRNENLGRGEIRGIANRTGGVRRGGNGGILGGG